MNPNLNELLLALVVPLALWLFDILIKILGSISTDDVGADLCLFGVSFNATTLLVSTISALKTGSGQIRSPGELAAYSSLALVISLLFYVFSLIVIAPNRRRGYPRLLELVRNWEWGVLLTVTLGFLALSFEVIIFLAAL